MHLLLTALKAVGLRFRQKEECDDLGRQVTGIADSTMPAGYRRTLRLHALSLWIIAEHFIPFMS